MAYGVLGSVSDAEEVIQESWLRLERVDGAEIENLTGWLTTTVVRLSLDALNSASRKRESYFGQWLPEPLVSSVVDEDPADRITLDEAVAASLVVVLQCLTPAERTSFLLHETFGMPFSQIAELVGRSPGAVRQLASRARRNVAAAKPRFPTSREQQERTLFAFAAACASGSLEGLIDVLDPDVVMRSDGGGRVPSARFPLRGPDRVARALLAIERKRVRDSRPFDGHLGSVNGAPGFLFDDGIALNVMSFVFNGGRIAAINVVRNPEKLHHVALPV